METDILKRFPRLRPFKQRVTDLGQRLNHLQQLSRRVKARAVNLGELNYLIHSKLEQSKHHS
ncbi:MAG: hypothetical protein KA314_19525 [Chloroflexi bacterium]|nr:hypothetical protein [Chloroflexota bacterium]MBP8058025.1 hypothetical protein [Chloroflexota bacterium]